MSNDIKWFERDPLPHLVRNVHGDAWVRSCRNRYAHIDGHGVNSALLAPQDLEEEFGPFYPAEIIPVLDQCVELDSESLSEILRLYAAHLTSQLQEAFKAGSRVRRIAALRSLNTVSRLLDNDESTYYTLIGIEDDPKLGEEQA